MNTLFPFLDIAPMTPSVYVNSADPATVIVVLLVLVLFLGFVGYLVWKSIRSRHDK